MKSAYFKGKLDTKLYLNNIYIYIYMYLLHPEGMLYIYIYNYINQSIRISNNKQ